MLENGWSVWPQGREKQRKPPRIGDEMLSWKALRECLPDEEEMKTFVRQASRANVACALGTASGNTFCLDIDCMDAAVSSRIQAIAAEVLGHTPFIHIGRVPQVAFIYSHGSGGHHLAECRGLKGMMSAPSKSSVWGRR